MTSVMSTFKAKALIFIALISLLGLAACGNTSSTSSKGTIIITSKLDTENQLLAEMYDLLLTKAGYHINLKLAYGNTPFNFDALKNGDSDIYPEFTATGLNTLSVASAYNPQKDYQTVKQGFEQHYHITWLDDSPLNDGYALCMAKAHAQALGISTISQLAPKVSGLTLESPSDGISFVDNLQNTYHFSTSSFKQTQTVDYAVGLTTVVDN